MKIFFTLLLICAPSVKSLIVEGVMTEILAAFSAGLFPTVNLSAPNTCTPACKAQISKLFPVK